MVLGRPRNLVRHGNRTGYEEDRCRCAACRAWRHNRYLDETAVDFVEVAAAEMDVEVTGLLAALRQQEDVRHAGAMQDILAIEEAWKARTEAIRVSADRALLRDGGSMLRSIRRMLAHPGE